MRSPVRHLPSFQLGLIHNKHRYGNSNSIRLGLRGSQQLHVMTEECLKQITQASDPFVSCSRLPRECGPEAVWHVCERQGAEAWRGCGWRAAPAAPSSVPPCFLMGPNASPLRAGVKELPDSRAGFQGLHSKSQPDMGPGAGERETYIN